MIWHISLWLFLQKWMIVFGLSTTWFSDLYMQYEARVCNQERLLYCTYSFFALCNTDAVQIESQSKLVFTFYILASSSKLSLDSKLRGSNGIKNTWFTFEFVWFDQSWKICKKITYTTFFTVLMSITPIKLELIWLLLMLLLLAKIF